MATILEFDRRYRSEGAATNDIPHLGVVGWHVVERPDGTFRLQLRVGTRAEPVLRQLKRLFPLYTFRVISSDEDST